MIPRNARRSIEAVLDLHGKLPVIIDDRLEDGTFFVVGEYGEKPYIKACVRWANWAIELRDNSLVPELYSDEASTWA
jgi:hypothetical protein